MSESWRWIADNEGGMSGRRSSIGCLAHHGELARAAVGESGVVVNLIGHTRTKSGLTIRSELDENSYPTGQTVSDEQMETLNLKRDRFHGEWNYMLTPRQ